MATFISRRKPKRVGARDESQPLQDDDDQDTGPVVRRPAKNEPKNKSKLRISFDPTEAEGRDGDHSWNSSLKRPYKATTAQSLLSNSTAASYLPPSSIDVLSSNERPSYSRDHLLELRNSTPSTPKDLSAYASSAEGEEAATLDVAAKFDHHHISRPSTNLIPSAAEIQEKKERRARLVKEQGAEDFIALEDYDSDGEFKPHRMQVGQFLPRDSGKDTRLVRDDEDMAEGFDDFVEDAGRVTLSRKLRKLQDRKEQEARREMVDEAEDSSDEDDSEAERNDAYVAAQVSHGMEGLRQSEEACALRPKPPKELAKIPKMSEVLAKLRQGVQELEFEKAKLLKRKADLQQERVRVVSSQVRVQELLTEAGKRFEELKNEAQSDQNLRLEWEENGERKNRV